MAAALASALTTARELMAAVRVHAQRTAQPLSVGWQVPSVLRLSAMLLLPADLRVPCCCGRRPAGEATQVTRPMQLSLCVGKANLLLRNLLRTPILELEASKINLGMMMIPATLCCLQQHSDIVSALQLAAAMHPVVHASASARLTHTHTHTL